MTLLNCTDSASIICLLLLGLLWYIGGSPPVLRGLKGSVRTLKSDFIVLIVTAVMIVSVSGKDRQSFGPIVPKYGTEVPLWCGLGLVGQLGRADLVARVSVVSKSKVQSGKYLATLRIDKLLYSSDQDLTTKFLRLKLSSRPDPKDKCSSVTAKVKPNNKYLVMVKNMDSNIKLGVFASASDYSLVSPPIKSSKKLIREVKSILLEIGSQRVRVRRGRGKQLEPKSNSKQTSSKQPSSKQIVSRKQTGSGSKQKKQTTTQGAKRSRTRLSCSAKGNPPPTLYWTMNGKIINNSTSTRITTKNLSKFLRKSILRLRGSVSRSSVHLQCHAYNAYGHTSKVKMGKTIHTPGKDMLMDQKVKKRNRSKSRLKGLRKSSKKSYKGPSLLSKAIHSPLSSSHCPIPDFCMNGGTCQFFSTIGEQTCHCAKGFHGRRCEMKYASTTRNLGPHMSDRFPLCLLGMAHYPC